MTLHRMTETYPTDVYRLYDDVGRLLYVGLAVNGYGRLKTHRREKTWWPEVRRGRMTQYANRRTAEIMEARAIRDEAPLHNVTRRYFAGDESIPDGLEAPIEVDEFEVIG